MAYIQIDTTASIWFDRVKEQAALELPFDNVAFADTETPGMIFPFNISEHTATLRAALADIKPVLVIWDTIREAHRADENDSTPMQAVVSQMLSATRGNDWVAANLWLSHRKKENANYEDDLMNANRGSSYLAGTCDSIIQLYTPAKKTGKATLEFASRTHEQERRAVVWDRTRCLWVLDEEEDATMIAVKHVLSLEGLSDRQRAEELAPLLSKVRGEECTIEAARQVLKRRKKAFGGK